MSNNEKEVILSSETKVTQEYIRPKQSANSLFHFMKKEEWLLNKIRDKALIPRYTLEDVRFLNLSNIEKMYYPMVCFCDLNLHRIEPHYREYGPYGIAFSKEWGIENGIQPVHYLNSKSDYAAEFKHAYDEGMEIDEANVLKDYWLESVRYTKPMQGSNICHEDDEHINFMDECEWRFVPHPEEETQGQSLLPAIVWKQHFSVDKHNTALEIDKKFWLTFDYSDIKYIILPDLESVRRIMDYCKELKIDEEEREILYTKIIDWSYFKEDV